MAMITVSEAVKRIREAGHDISEEYSDEKCVEFLNTAIQQVSSLLVSSSWPMKPAGNYPIRMTNGRVEIVDDAYNVVRFRYFTTPANVTIEDDMPFEHDGVNDVILRSAVILALNENEYDVSQDTAIMTALQQAIASGMA